MKKLAIVCATALAGLLLSACSEYALVRSYPPGAKLFVNGQFTGVTPVIYRIKHSQIGDPQQVRFEADGYEPREAVLATRICPGRIVGGVFTLGIVLMIRGPTCFVSPQDFMLQPLPKVITSTQVR